MPGLTGTAAGMLAEGRAGSRRHDLAGLLGQPVRADGGAAEECEAYVDSLLHESNGQAEACPSSLVGEAGFAGCEELRGWRGVPVFPHRTTKGNPLPNHMVSCLVSGPPVAPGSSVKVLGPEL